MPPAGFDCASRASQRSVVCTAFAFGNHSPHQTTTHFSGCEYEQMAYINTRPQYAFKSYYTRALVHTFIRLFVDSPSLQSFKRHRRFISISVDVPLAGPTVSALNRNRAYDCPITRRLFNEACKRLFPTHKPTSIWSNAAPLSCAASALPYLRQSARAIHWSAAGIW